MLADKDAKMKVVNVKPLPRKILMKTFSTKEKPKAIKSKARLKIIFRESEGKSVKKEVDFMVLDGARTMIAFGKPTMDFLGFRSNRRSIYLAREDIRFPTTVTEHDDREELYACSYDHEVFDGNSTKTDFKNVKIKVPKECKGGAWWVEDHHRDPEFQVVEGPLIRLKDNSHAAMVRVLSNGKHRCGPGDRLAKIRPMEPADEELLNRCIEVSTASFQSMYDRKKIQAASQDEAVPTTPHAAFEEPHATQEEVDASGPDTAGEEGEINEAKYVKVGRKDRQAALFPALQEEG